MDGLRKQPRTSRHQYSQVLTWPMGPQRTQRLMLFLRKRQWTLQIRCLALIQQAIPALLELTRRRRVATIHGSQAFAGFVPHASERRADRAAKHRSKQRPSP